MPEDITRSAGSELTAEQVRGVGRLARLELTEAEIAGLTTDLNTLMGHFQHLEELDTSSVEPTFHVLELSNVLRQDETRASLSIEDVVANAPASDGPFFVVPRIVETG